MPATPEPKSHQNEAAAGTAKLKSEDRRAQLEAFRAVQAAKKAASLGHKIDLPATAPAKALKSRVPASLKGDLKGSATPSAGKKAASLSPERKPAVPKTARPHSSTAAVKAKPPISARGPASAKPPLGASLGKEAAADEGLDGSGKPGGWMGAQQAFGFESSRPMESRRGSQTGEAPAFAPATTLGAGFGDDGDPNMGIRWQIQVEKLRLQQWHILNARLDAACAGQQKQADQQIEAAAEATAALQQQIKERTVKQAKAENVQRAADALAVQMPRLELYASMKERHKESMQKITASMSTALQQMPLINGAVCGDSAEAADAQEMFSALREIQNALSELEPRLKPFLGKVPAGGAQNSSEPTEVNKENDGSLACTAEAAASLSAVDAELRQYLRSNAELLKAVEGEVVHAESLAAQLMLANGGK